MATTASPKTLCLPRSARPRSASSSYRHNPYAYVVLQEKDRERATESFGYIYSVFTEEEADAQRQARGTKSGSNPSFARCGSDSKLSSSCPTPQTQPLDVVSAKLGATADSSNDDGVSETSSETGSQHNKDALGKVRSAFSVTALQSHAAAAAAAGPAAGPAVIRYASVNFRFGSAWFVAPFRTFTGDMVVVQYPSNGSLHMGLVSSITTAKPITFYTEDNMDSNFLTAEELQTVPRLLRHARDFDKETKLDLRSHDLGALANARKLAAELGAPVQFLDAEWLLDLSAVTFLVKVFGNASLVDKLVDELAMQEGAEVVFTYPVSSSTMY
ncbi:hypothetical protein NESM_000114200 [Novymonas esmeraldas]|uniref:Uncharacterized protein n=1 Tax=Novymonas esmeraldas TaxID=1808958 RepID=A0AAW0F5Z2_9TRYP